MRAQGRARPPYDSGSNESLILSGDWYNAVNSPGHFKTFFMLRLDTHSDFFDSWERQRVVVRPLAGARSYGPTKPKQDSVSRIHRE